MKRVTVFFLALCISFGCYSQVGLFSIFSQEFCVDSSYRFAYFTKYKAHLFEIEAINKAFQKDSLTSMTVKHYTKSPRNSFSRFRVFFKNGRADSIIDFEKGYSVKSYYSDTVIDSTITRYFNNNSIILH